MAFDTASKTIDLGATPSELESVLRAYEEDISPPVALTIAQRYELVGEAGQREHRRDGHRRDGFRHSHARVIRCAFEIVPDPGSVEGALHVSRFRL